MSTPTQPMPGEKLNRELAKEVIGLLIKKIESDQANKPMLEISDRDLVLLEDFLKDYTAGIIHSIDPDDIKQIKRLEPGQCVIICINRTVQKIKRIS